MDQRKSETRGMKVPYQIDKAKIRGANYNSSIQQLLTGMVKKFPEAIFKALQKELKKGSCRLK